MRDANGSTHYFCLHNANGNLGQLVDRGNGSSDYPYYWCGGR